MRKHVLILMVISLGFSISGFGQMKMNSAGRAFFGSGAGTTSYGAINLTNDGTANGISFTGTSANRYRMFKYNDELYITANSDLSRGMKIGPTGGVAISSNTLSTSWSTPVLTLTSREVTVLEAHGNHSFSNAKIIKASVFRPDVYAFVISTQYSPYENPFYVTGNGTVYAKNGYLQSSDANNKEEVKPLEKSLDKISALSGVSYYYRDFVEQTLEGLSELSSEISRGDMENDTISGRVKVKAETVEQMKKEATRKRIGLIAQEVEQIVPEAVRTMDDGKKGIMYSDLISLLIEGIKELKLIVDEQKNINESQEEYIHELEERLGVLEGSILKEKQFAEKTTDISLSKINAKLYQNTPNPFDKETEVKYTIPENVEAYIAIYDLNGRQLKKHSLYDNLQGSIVISSSEFAPGIYLYSLIVDNQEIDTKRMLLTE